MSGVHRTPSDYLLVRELGHVALATEPDSSPDRHAGPTPMFALAYALAQYLSSLTVVTAYDDDSFSFSGDVAAMSLDAWARKSAAPPQSDRRIGWQGNESH